MIPENKKKALTEEWHIPLDLLERIENSNAVTAEKAISEGIESKETGEQPAAETPVVKEDVAEETEAHAEAPVETVASEQAEKPVEVAPITREEIADALASVLAPMADRIGALESQNEALLKEIASFKKDDEEKVKEAAAQTPTASITSLLQARSALRTTETAVDGRSSLAKSHPKETKSYTSGNRPTGIPFIDDMIAPESEE